MATLPPKDIEFAYADKPIYFRLCVEEYGLEALADLTGYVIGSLQAMYAGKKGVRQIVEFACENYYKNQHRKDDDEKIFFFLAKENGKELPAIQAMMDALGITIQKL